jgi:hypothetical protein
MEADERPGGSAGRGQQPFGLRVVGGPKLVAGRSSRRWRAEKAYQGEHAVDLVSGLRQRQGGGEEPARLLARTNKAGRVLRSQHQRKGIAMHAGAL